jgi:hypothetical protein
VSGQLHALAALPSGKKPSLPFGLESRPGRRGEEKILDRTEIRNPTHWYGQINMYEKGGGIYQEAKRCIYNINRKPQAVP